jgi:hypothetical protein
MLGNGPLMCSHLTADYSYIQQRMSNARRHPIMQFERMAFGDGDVEDLACWAIPGTG